MNDPVKAGEPKTPRRPGRPRSLEIDQIIDAALDLGLESLTMGRVADRLGVVKAALYNYVATREELVMLAAARAAGMHPFPEDEGQSWKDYALDHARALFELLTGDAQLLISYMTGGMGQLASADRTEAWLRAMTKRGFTADEAIRLLQSIGYLVVGAAASALHAKAAATPEDEARAILRKRGAHELPLLRAALESASERSAPGNWERALMIILDGSMPKAAAD
ncbi:Regulatory protein TetR [Sphingomonas paucimobilis]|uniref:TetR/AcrR family transcriptional regulator C-terminal domain-containing protein n=1 Tax=Sphingobium sp. DC-2 TaxID=1303256 RepID=UPI00044EAD23|nr:TetR/AcrR family transcriptional regulator C-terminal domain-containing protein [Sphingobium sp. DC-2]EZP74190.1 Regulatory protein TetR [Sphingomonas paucimobilis]